MHACLNTKKYEVLSVPPNSFLSTRESLKKKKEASPHLCIFPSYQLCQGKCEADSTISGPNGAPVKTNFTVRGRRKKKKIQEISTTVITHNLKIVFSNIRRKQFAFKSEVQNVSHLMLKQCAMQNKLP